MQTADNVISMKDKTFIPWVIVLLCFLIGTVWYFVPHPLVVIALSLMPLAILFTLRFPVPIGLMFIVFSFFRLHEALPMLYSLRIPLMLSLATISTLSWHLFISQKIRIYYRPEMIAFLVFFILVFIGIVFAGNRPEAISYFKSTFVKIGIMTPVLAWLLCEVNHFKLTLIMVICGGLVVGFVTMFNKLSGIGLVEETRVTVGRELGSVLGDPNDLALVLLFPFSFAISVLMTKGLSVKFRLLGFIATSTLFSAIMATQSRGGLLGILAVVGIVAFRRVKSKILFFVAGGIATLLLFVMAGISGRKSGGAAEEGLDESAMGRLHAWEAAFGMAVDNPITGVGINNFYFNYYFYSKYWDGLNHAVHSTWFGVLAETGFIGLFAFLTMVIITFKTANTTLKKVTAHNPSRHGRAFSPVILAISEGNLAGVAAFCVSGTFLTQGFTWPLYILIALTAAVAQFVEHKGKNYDD